MCWHFSVTMWTSYTRHKPWSHLSKPSQHVTAGSEVLGGLGWFLSQSSWWALTFSCVFDCFYYYYLRLSVLAEIMFLFLGVCILKVNVCVCVCRTMACLPRSVLRSSQGPQSRPMITPPLRRAARVVRRVRVAREQRRKKAPQIGNTNAYKW